MHGRALLLQCLCDALRSAAPTHPAQPQLLHVLTVLVLCPVRMQSGWIEAVKAKAIEIMEVASSKFPDSITRMVHSRSGVPRQCKAGASRTHWAAEHEAAELSSIAFFPGNAWGHTPFAWLLLADTSLKGVNCCCWGLCDACSSPSQGGGT